MKRKPARKKIRSIVNRSQKKKIARVLVAGLFFTVSLVFLFSYSFHNYLNQNFASALSATSYSISDDNIPTVSYIVTENISANPVVVKKISFLIFDKQNQKVSIYNVPTHIKFEIPGRFGNEEFSKMFALGAMNSENALVSGTDLINRSIFKLFGFKVDRFLLADSSQEAFFDKLWKEGGSINIFNLKSVSNFQNTLQTNLSLREFNNLLSLINSLPQDRIIDSTNTPKNFNDTSAFDENIKDETYESYVAQEKKNIAILNGTNFNGLATFGSRVVKNIGGRVVAVNNSEKFYEKSIIVAQDPNSKTVAFLSRVFKIPTIIQKEEARSFNENEIDRSDVTVIFGFDTSGDLY
ncbi:MAG: LytR C-terminal domain-containing protein [Patescibacteria group bacterium]